MSQHGKRKKLAAAEKLRIVLAGMQPNVEVSELCGREGINPTQKLGEQYPISNQDGRHRSWIMRILLPIFMSR